MKKPKSRNKLLLEGRNIVLDALKAGQKIESVLIADSVRADDKIEKITNLAKQNKVQVNIVDSLSLDSVSYTKNHQGVIASLNYLSPVSLLEILEEKDNAFILLFNKIDYEQNMGAMLRSAAATGVDAVVVSPQGVDEVTPTVARISMGGALYVPIISQSLFQALTLLKEKGYFIAGVDATSKKEFTEVDLTGKVVFLFGGEESGLTEPLKKYCDFIVNIPMQNNMESLNMSVSASLLMYEKLRQDKNSAK